MIMNMKNETSPSSHSFKKNIPALFLAMKDKETPIGAKILATITVIYALSPIDLIPDFLPVIGYLDDVIILPILVVLTIKLIPTALWERYLKDAEDMWKDGKPKKWYYAIPIIMIWLFIIWLVVKAVLF